jgi:hypothetical protein
MHTVLMNVTTLRNGRFVGVVRVDGIVTATTLPFTSRNTAARVGFSLKSDRMRDERRMTVHCPHSDVAPCFDCLMKSL